MQVEDQKTPTPNSSPTTPPSSQPPSSTFGKKAVMFGGGILIILALFRSCSKPEQPPAQSQPRSSSPAQVRQQPAPEPQVEQEPIDRAVVRRNALLQEAIEQSQSIAENLLCSRSEYFLVTAQAKAVEQGTTVEAWLTSTLAEVVSKNQAATVTQATFGADAEQIAIARAYNLDALALLLALQHLYNGERLTGCTITPAASILSSQSFVEQAKLLQSRSAQTQLVIQSQQGERSNDSPIP